MTKILKIVALLAALALFAVACGSDGDSGDASGDTVAETSDDSESEVDDSSGDDSDGDTDEIATGIGVTDEEINIGLLTDLTGIFAGLTVPITDGTEAYFERLNEAGGVAGREVRPISLDTVYDVSTHQQHYDTFAADGADGVAMLGMSVGSPHTASIREDLIDDNLAAIPVSWNSSWAADSGVNVLEWGANYCVEAMNGIDFLSSQFAGATVAIVGFPGDYGEDGALGAKIAAEALGLEVVYDGQGQVVPGADQTPVIAEIVASEADIVWASTNPTTLVELMGGAAAQGFTGQWGGNGPTYSPLLLNTEAAPLLDASYTHFSPFNAIGAEGAGNADVRAMMQEFRPEAPFLSTYVVSWIQGEIVRQTLEAAADNGDLTRQGILDAALSTTFEFQGVLPDTNFSGDANELLIRSSFVFDVSLDDFVPGATVTDGAGEGLVLIDDAYTSSVAEGFEYEPCFGL